MVQFKPIFLITIIGMVVLFSGCTGKQEGTPTPTTSTPAVTATPAVTVTTAIPEATPTSNQTPVATTKKLPPDTIFVDARMTKPAFWGIDNYELRSLQVQVINQRSAPLSITSQIVNSGQVLEEKTFVLESEGSSYSFANEKTHFINNTNVTLHLLIQGYQPVEYNFKEISS